MDPFTLALLAGGTKLATGLFSSYQQKKAAERSAAAQMASIREAIKERRLSFADAQNMLQPYVQSGTVAQNQIDDALSSGKFTLDDGSTMDIYAVPKDFHYGVQTADGQDDYAANVQKFLDPSMQYQQTQAQRGLEQSAAARGALTSGATLSALQNQAQDYAAKDWNNAAGIMTNDKNNTYNRYMDQFNAQRQNVANRFDQLNKISARGYGAQGTLAQGRMNNGAAIGGLMTDQGNAQAAHDMAGNLMLSNMAGDVAQGLGSAASMYSLAGGFDKAAEPGSWNRENPYDARTALSAQGAQEMAGYTPALPVAPPSPNPYAVRASQYMNGYNPTPAPGYNNSYTVNQGNY